jgi:hypothetical protein
MITWHVTQSILFSFHKYKIHIYPIWGSIRQIMVRKGTPFCFYSCFEKKILKYSDTFTFLNNYSRDKTRNIWLESVFFYKLVSVQEEE